MAQTLSTLEKWLEQDTKVPYQVQNVLSNFWIFQVLLSSVEAIIMLLNIHLRPLDILIKSTIQKQRDNTFHV